MVDLVLSSGFLAFARHIGFLAAVDERGLEVEAVLGTSSGAMVGALWLAGLSKDELRGELGSAAPLSSLMISRRPWRGLFDMKRVITRLAARLPARIEDLPRPFAVGVMNASGAHEILRAGPLAEAIAASCAIPRVFHPVSIGEAVYADGGAVDRLGLDAWRAWRPGRRAIAHWVERSAGRDTDASLDQVFVVRSARSGARLWSLGDFEAQLIESQSASRDQLASYPPG